MDLPNAISKHLKPLGHELALWQEAIVLLHGRLTKNRLPPDLSAFLTHWLPQKGGEPVPSQFDIWLGQDAVDRLTLRTSSVAFAADPAWWALLQLPALKAHWAAGLRASHHEHLLTLLPHAWLVDPAPLPPGAVIPHLNLPDWRHIPSSLTSHPLPDGRTVLVKNPIFVQQWRATYVKDESGIHLQSASLS